MRDRLIQVLARSLTPVMLGFAATLFVCGIAFPFFDVTQFWVFSDTVSVLSGLGDMARADEWFLFGVILVFTIVFPAVKLLMLTRVWWNRGRHDERADRALRWVSHLGKWSMLDVFVVAILVVTIKASQIARISIDHGVYLFSASIVLTQLTALRLERRLR